MAKESQNQFTLALPQRSPHYSRETFLISDSNEAAWKTAQAWRQSQEAALIICGPEGSGKTHLAYILAEDGGEYFVQENLTAIRDAPLIVIDNLPAPDPKEFLRILEELTTSGTRIVLAGAGHPGEWALGLKDLRTRLEAMPRASLGEPDEALIRAVITKGFLDRQLAVSKAVADFAAPRLQRTFAAAHKFVDAADSLSLSTKKKISVQLVQKIIESQF